MTAILQLSDGTTTVDFLSPTSGIHLSNWMPSLPGWKSGGIWSGSPLSDGRRLSVRSFDNVVDLFELKVTEASQDQVVQTARDLRNLLEKSVAYWTGVEDDPVYLIARGPCETQTRYAVVAGWKTDQESNPYAQPFFSVSPLDEFSVAVEHGIWQEDPPGTATAVQAAATQTWNATAYGQAATTAAEVFVANRHNDANLTHIYYYDDGTAAFSANLFGAALPYDLYPAIPAVDDLLYVGSNDAIAGSGPFASVVFDIGTAQADLSDIDFEYWNGAWTALPRYSDSTNMFRNTGVRSFAFEQPNDWAATAINGVTAWWIRFHITAIGAAPTPPAQANRQPYAVTWPALEVDELQVGGDLPALARYKVYAMTYAFGGSASVQQQIYRVTAGLRSTSRGSSFRAYLNASSEQNDPGVVISLGGTSAPAHATRAEAPTGVADRYNPGGASSGTITWPLTYSTVAAHYRGKFRAYARVFLDSLVTDCYLKLTVDSLNYDWTSENLYPAAGVDFEVLDFGMIDIPGMTIKGSQVFTSNLILTITNGTGSPNLWVYDLILIPVDEWSVDSYEPTDRASMGNGNMLDIDSVLSPRQWLYTDEVNAALSLKYAGWLPISGGPAILQASADQKLYFFFQQWDGTNNVWYARPYLLAAVQVERCQRYLSLRGAR